ncbi:hypothetical protein GJ496_002342 [Pomphorhynchus laevis]|nr:hypothetical protein GJ496_002342 [Pomphorhynchus laevis]
MMEITQRWYADGAFKVAPTLFVQLCTIYAIKYNGVLPNIYALPPHKTECTYQRMFADLKTLNPNIQPISVMTDFKIDARNAIRSAFPETELAGCLFHFGNYKEDPEFACYVKCFQALAFVPVEDVISSFEILVQEASYAELEGLHLFIDYFEDTWIGTNQRGQRRDPRYEIKSWNCLHRVIQGIARANNYVEDWHRGFYFMVGAEHPSIWKLIDKIKLDQSLNEVRISQCAANQQNSQKNLIMTMLSV